MWHPKIKHFIMFPRQNTDIYLGFWKIGELHKYYFYLLYILYMYMYILETLPKSQNPKVMITQMMWNYPVLD